ncbi:vesicle-associated membrane protein 5 isoform X1 [Prionailurus bengalensis]|uniref:vesicle-associated membrane protein 5 isoform X1 n=1 Tax=Prionailurus bengalensis TaxID=37029 RepID=UPI001CA8D845|nr:vesicle-associated membrane protein 5 isoform X1 [Prionailurus bengalensis]
MLILPLHCTASALQTPSRAGKCPSHPSFLSMLFAPHYLATPHPCWWHLSTSSGCSLCLGVFSLPSTTNREIILKTLSSVPHLARKSTLGRAGKELERCQRQADEVTEIMLNNFDKVLERDGKLAELEQRSDQLLDMSSAFSKTTKTLAQKKSWENIRCRIYLGLVVGGGLLVILIVLLAIFLPQSSEGSSAPQAQDAGAASGPGD